MTEKETNMNELKKVKGTRFIAGCESEKQTQAIRKLCDYAKKRGFKRVYLPSLDFAAMEWKPDTKVYYVEKSWRYDQPQAGWCREFTQFGMGTFNCTNQTAEEWHMQAESRTIAQLFNLRFQLNNRVERGSGCYRDGVGFEIECPRLGAQKQVFGGGSYQCRGGKTGVGFALGVDRLCLAMESCNE